MGQADRLGADRSGRGGEDFQVDRTRQAGQELFARLAERAFDVMDEFGGKIQFLLTTRRETIGGPCLRN